MKLYFLIYILFLLSFRSNSTNIDEGNSNTKHHKHMKDDPKNRCFLQNGPCSEADTYCGVWIDRYFHRKDCSYQDITSLQAKQCLGNRTIAFIGDSQIRDIGVGVKLLLEGVLLKNAPDHKFDHNDNLNTVATQIAPFALWGKNNVPPHNGNGFIIPKQDNANKEPWQIQIWSLFRNEFINDNHLDNVLSKSSPLLKENKLLKPIDLAFVSWGLHDWGWWDKVPYGENYYKSIVSKWLNFYRDENYIQSVWVSMNSECVSLLDSSVLGDRKNLQVDMVEEANKYLNERLMNDQIPYWDAAEVLKTSNRCSISSDGLHVKQWVDVMRAKILFNHLCDENMNWRGSSNIFKSKIKQNF